MNKNPKGDREINMKHRFLILPVAFLFCCTGCGVRKKSPVTKSQQPQKKQIFDQNSKNAVLIKRSSQPVAHASSAKNKKEEMSVVVQEEQRHSFKNYSVKERIMEIEARLGDLPLPLMAKGISASDDGHGRYLIVCKTELSLVDLIDFYTQEMERLGWVKIAAFEHEELLVSFKRQRQSCIVSMRPAKQSWWSKIQTLLYVYLQA